MKKKAKVGKTSGVRIVGPAERKANAALKRDDAERLRVKSLALLEKAWRQIQTVRKYGIAEDRKLRWAQQEIEAVCGRLSLQGK